MRPRTLALLAAAMTLARAADVLAFEAPESKLFTTRDFKLESGVVLPELTLAYETYGKLAPDGRNAVLYTHGYTSSHHAAGRYGATGAAKGHKGGDVGSWDKLIGPGKAIDTDKLFVVASNMLGSSYGSTNPASIDPKTGKPYGPDFPRHTVVDIVRAQKALLDHLGVKHLVAVVGPSYGGYQAFQWAVTYPDFMRGIVPVVTAPKSTGGAEATQKLIQRLAEDPNWNGGWYYDKGGVAAVLTKIRVATLKFYGIEAQLAAQYPDAAEREAAIVKQAEPWAQNFDANSHGGAAPRARDLRHDARVRKDQGQGALRHLPHRQPVPALDRAGVHAGSQGRRRRCPLLRDRQRARTPRQRPRRRQVGARR